MEFKRHIVGLFLVFTVGTVGLPRCALAADEHGASGQRSISQSEGFAQFFQRGVELFEKGNYSEAITEFNRALILDPTSSTAKEYIIRCNRNIAVQKPVPSPEKVRAQQINAHIQAGARYFDDQKYDEAIGEWEQVLLLDPENEVAETLIGAAKKAKIDLFVEKGAHLFDQQRYDEAIAAWQQILEIEPDNLTATELIFQTQRTKHEMSKQKARQVHQLDLKDFERVMDEEIQLPEGYGAHGFRREPVFWEAERAPRRAPSPRETIIKELKKPVSLDFVKVNLRAVIRHLAEVTGINILIDERVFEEFGEEFTEEGEELLTPEIWVTIFAQNLPLESALKGMLKQVGLDYAVATDLIFISTPRVVQGFSFESLETRFYRLRDTSRMSLAKVIAPAAQTGGGGGSVITRLQTVSEQQIGDFKPDIVGHSVAKLVHIIRNFIPEVVETSGELVGGRERAKAGTENIQGGFEMSPQDEAYRTFLEEKEMRYDVDDNRILSRIDYDPHTNMLIVKNTPTNLDMLEVFLDQLDLEPRQVSVEAKFMTVSLGDIYQFGVDWEWGGDLSGSSLAKGSEIIFPNTKDISKNAGPDEVPEQDFLGYTTTPTVTGANRAGFPFTPSVIGDFVSGITSGGLNVASIWTRRDGDFIQAVINTLEGYENTEVLSIPKVTTMHAKAAVIASTTTESFLTDLDITTTVTAGTAGGSPVLATDIDPTIEEFTFGLTLTVTPFINPDGTIRMFLYPEITDRIGEKKFVFVTEDVISELTRPTIKTQAVLSNVLVHDGDTLVLGGLMKAGVREQRSGIPFLMHIPFLGKFFQTEGNIRGQDTLLIFITVNRINTKGAIYSRVM